ncbi:hypothetical protein NC651_012389 [Populus alba x Populus x berolinensis]|nr:hypothetical protein NC651_012389 [Populus alba x Populus x berolinensis]
MLNRSIKILSQRNVSMQISGTSYIHPGADSSFLKLLFFWCPTIARYEYLKAGN